MIFGDDEYEVGTAGQVTYDTANISRQGPGVEPVSTPSESPTDWSSIVSGLLSIGRRGTTPTTQTARAAPTWVWALPVAAGGLLLLAAVAKGGRRTALAGYRRRRRR